MSDDGTNFEWDDEKRLKTIEKHGIDFQDLGPLFASDHIVAEARSESETRLIAIGELKGLMIAVIFTERNGRRRIITARRARQHEREDFRALYAGPTSRDEGQD